MYSFIVSFSAIFIRFYNIRYAVIYAFLSFFILTAIGLCVYRKQNCSYRAIFLPLVIFTLVQLFLVVLESLIVFGKFFNCHAMAKWEFIFCFLGVGFGYLFYKSKSYIKIVPILTSLLISYFFINYFVPMIYNKHNTGSYFGEITSVIPNNLNFENESGEFVGIDSIEGELVVFDFWITECGVCYRIMPEINKLYEEYKENVTFLSIHTYTKKETYNTGREILAKISYHKIPSLSISVEQARSILKIEAYPEIVLMNDKKQILYNGNIDMLERAIKKSLNIN